jgi:type VI secretion system protein ImpJ
MDVLMSWNNKVIWSEGLFLRPQHFQQSDRYYEKLIRSRVAALRPYSWGITELKLNVDMLGLGKFAIDEARGVLEDGTPFSIPDDADHPAPLDVPENTRNSVVYLALPGYQPGALEAAPASATESVARVAIHEQEISDTIALGRADVGIEVGKLRLRFVLEGADRAGLICLGLARIGEIRADKQIVLDESFIPPTLDCAATKNLAGFIAEIQGLLHHRGEALGGRVADSGTRGVAEIADFMLLQAVNRYEPLFSHLVAARHIHPETFYAVCLQLAGELATFTAANKRPVAFPHYKHDDLAATFTPVMRSIRQSLSAVLEQTAVPIPLQERRYGVHVAPILDKTLLTTAAFVLAVKANIEAERLRRYFPAQVKLGPVESIRELVNSALPGIGLSALPVAPRQIPYFVGKSYFELDRSSPHWKAMQTSGGLALHVAGDFPGLEMELWAIRGQ